jgi:cytochrome c biogenesis protein CcmG, thiol:disulfide interchange protein DsbE
MRSIFIWSGAAAGVLFLAVSGSRVRAAGNVGEPAPALVVQELGGPTFSLAAARGNVVVVNFWATWCPPCRKEMPALDAFYRKYHDRGVQMIGISVDRPHDRSDVKKVMELFSYPAAMLGDAKVNDFGTPSALPTTVVVDANGVVRARLTPEQTPVTEKSLSVIVLPLLAQRSAGHASIESSGTETKSNP